MVAVDEHGRRAGRVEPVAVDVRRDARQLEDGDVLDAEAAEHVGGDLGRAPQVVGREAGGRDAGNAHELAQRVLELAEALVDGAQGRRPCRRGREAMEKAGARRERRAPWSSRYIIAVGGAGSSGAPAFASGRCAR